MSRPTKKTVQIIIDEYLQPNIVVRVQVHSAQEARKLEKHIDRLDALSEQLEELIEAFKRRV